MKKIVVLLLTSVLLTSPANAQLAVADIAATIGIEKGTIETVKNGLTQLRQLQTLAQQLEWLTSLTTSLVHDPNLGAIMQIANLLGLQSDIPLNLYAVQSLISGYGGIGSVNSLIGTAGGKLSLLGSVVNTSYNNDNLYSCRNSSFACAQTTANMTGLAGTKGVASTMLASLQNHLTVLQGLREKLATASPKDVMDVQAQVDIEQTWVNSQSAQFQAVALMSDVQSKVNDEQRTQRWYRDLDSFNGQVK